MTLDPQRRQALLEAKLGALVREAAGGAPGVFTQFAGGAALATEGEAWILADEQPERALGRAMAWARQHEIGRVRVLVDDPHAAGLLARRAARFRDAPAVWRVDGRALVEAEPDPLLPTGDVDPRLLAFVPLIEAGGARPSVEHGVLAGEVAGLEVCRAVIDPHLDVARLEVGVGAHDREAFQLIYGDVPPADALAEIVGKVAPHRRPGAPTHPLNRLAGERLLRDRLVREPAAVGVAWLVEAPPPVPRANLRDAVPCVAVGETAGGEPVVVVCSVGIDLDLVPFAADARLAVGPGHRLVLAVPERDVHPVTAALAARLLDPATIVGVLP